MRNTAGLRSSTMDPTKNIDQGWLYQITNSYNKTTWYLNKVGLQQSPIINIFGSRWFLMKPTNWKTSKLVWHSWCGLNWRLKAARRYWFSSRLTYSLYWNVHATDMPWMFGKDCWTTVMQKLHTNTKSVSDKEGSQEKGALYGFTGRVFTA